MSFNYFSNFVTRTREVIKGKKKPNLVVNPIGDITITNDVATPSRKDDG
jgi:hypothetical protein